MAKVVAKRKLKNSFYNKGKEVQIKDISMDTFDESINGLYRRNGAKKLNRQRKPKDKKQQEENWKSKLKQKVIFKLALQTISMGALFLFVMGVKVLDLNIVKNAEITKKTIKEFKTNYTKQQIWDKATILWDKVYLYVDPIIPDALSQKTVAVFSNIFKKEEKDKEENKKVDVYSEQKVEIYSEKESEETLQETNKEIIPVSSSISTMDENISKIKESNITFVKPTTGVITSKFGAREEIFEGVESYHLGTDIANVEGTKIVSSIDGTVTVVSNNSETGLYIEVQNGNITTRYCHLSKQVVKVGAKVKKGDKIGEMGKTGLVTGTHLHFEIMYNRERVDAERILKLN